MFQRLRFHRTRRLSHDTEYQAVFQARAKKVAGPLIVWGRPNTQPYWRLGLSIGRRIGNAVARNRAKRLVREAFRILQHELPLAESSEGTHGYDIVVTVRPGGEPGLADYQVALRQAAEALHKEWQRRAARSQARAKDHDA